VKRAFAAYGVAVLMLLTFASPALADADISVTQSAHQGEILWPMGPVHVGDITIGRRVTFDFRVENNGPEAATVVFRIRKAPAEDGYTFWTIPARVTQFAQSGEPDPTCNWDIMRCTMHLGAGRGAAFLMSVLGNAPGHLEVSSIVSTPAGDPDPSNNASTPFSQNVVCSILGTNGNDRLVGTNQRDSICGGLGDDVLQAVGHGDRLFGGNGDDRLIAAAGEQTYVGGRGIDTLSYMNAPRGVQVSLADRGGSGWGFDTLAQLEIVVGTRFADYIEGSSKNELLLGRGGADELFGQGGRDVLDGGLGLDEFISRDRAVDRVLGGGGDDDGYVDSYDRVASVRSVAYAPFSNRNISPRPPG
jgi:Ca2+-binding RTX toxin-like protein